MQKLIYFKTQNTVTLYETDNRVHEINEVVSVEADNRCFVVKVLNGNDPRPMVKLMCPISMTNLFIEK